MQKPYNYKVHGTPSAELYGGDFINKENIFFIYKDEKLLGTTKDFIEAAEMSEELNGNIIKIENRRNNTTTILKLKNS